MISTLKIHRKKKQKTKNKKKQKKKYTEYLRTYTDLAIGASGAALVVIGWRGQGVKGQEKE